MKKIVRNIIITIYYIIIAFGFFGLIDKNILPKNIFVYIVGFLIAVLGLYVIDKILKTVEK